MKSKLIITLLSLFLIASIPASYAHQIDSIGEYRVQIGWMIEPAVSGESNGIELFVSPLDPDVPAEKQEFKDGISGLQKDLKIQLVLKGDSITLPLRADHNVSGKYFALVEPTIPGYYQVNIIGNIGETIASKSLHAPKVENKEHLQFPTLPEDPIVQDHENFKDEITEIQASIEQLESTPESFDLGYVGIGIGIIAIVIAGIAFKRK